MSLLGARDGSGMVEQMDMEQITMDGVGTPIVVDNTHCPPSHHGCTHPARGMVVGLLFKLLIKKKTLRWVHGCSDFQSLATL